MKAFIATGLWRMDEPVTSTVLERIQRGALDSKNTKELYKQILRAAGVKGRVIVYRRPRRPTG